VDDGPHANICLVLDPRSKLDYHTRNEWEEQYIQQARTILENEYEQYIDDGIHQTNQLPSASASASATNDVALPSAPNSTTNTLFEDFLDEIYGGETNEAIEDEVQRYLSTPVVRKIDPLNWWKTNRNEFPVLSSIVRDYFATPGNSETVKKCIGTYDVGIRILNQLFFSVSQKKKQRPVPLVKS
jgi:hypothetical protein